MCSIAIPSELLLGHSPPVYGSLLYSSLMVTTPPIANRSVPPQIRPCLAQGSLQLAGLLKSTSSDSDAASNNNSNKRNKKRVVFADDRGRPLTQVRVMSEPSNMPPLWTSAYVASLASGGIFRNLDGSLANQTLTTCGGFSPYDKNSLNNESNDSNNSSNNETSPKAEQPWETCFSQPASDYLAFRNKLDKNSVSLENVIVREAEGCLIGTVKVKNITYDKEVTLRATSDNWCNYEDVVCTYVEQPGLVSQHAVRNLYDTFRFRITLPITDGNSSNNKLPRQLEFCVCYKTAGQEHWDNNDGANYIVKKKRDVTIEEQVAELLQAYCGPDATHNGFAQSRLINRDNIEIPADEATRVHLRTWSEFASWQHLETDGPYW